jgi:hypothetical protein
VAAENPQVAPSLTVLGCRVVRLIETHSAELAQAVVESVRKYERCQDFFLKVPPPELQHYVQEIYQHLGEWLTRKTERDVELRYLAIGKRRAEQGVSLSQLIFAIVATKEHLWRYVSNEVMSDPRPVEMFQEVELAQLVEQFFDRAIYHAAIGYERYHEAQEKPTSG